MPISEIFLWAVCRKIWEIVFAVSVVASAVYIGFDVSLARGFLASVEVNPTLARECVRETVTLHQTKHTQITKGVFESKCKYGGAELDVVMTVGSNNNPTLKSVDFAISFKTRLLLSIRTVESSLPQVM